MNKAIAIMLVILAMIQNDYVKASTGKPTPTTPTLKSHSTLSLQTLDKTFLTDSVSQSGTENGSYTSDEQQSKKETETPDRQQKKSDKKIDFLPIGENKLTTLTKALRNFKTNERKNFGFGCAVLAVEQINLLEAIPAPGVAEGTLILRYGQEIARAENKRVQELKREMSSDEDEEEEDEGSEEEESEEEQKEEKTIEETYTKARKDTDDNVLQGSPHMDLQTSPMEDDYSHEEKDDKSKTKTKKHKKNIKIPKLGFLGFPGLNKNMGRIPSRGSLSLSESENEERSDDAASDKAVRCDSDTDERMSFTDSDRYIDTESEGSGDEKGLDTNSDKYPAIEEKKEEKKEEDNSNEEEEEENYPQRGTPEIATPDGPVIPKLEFSLEPKITKKEKKPKTPILISANKGKKPAETGGEGEGEEYSEEEETSNRDSTRVVYDFDGKHNHASWSCSDDYNESHAKERTTLFSLIDRMLDEISKQDTEMLSESSNPAEQRKIRQWRISLTNMVRTIKILMPLLDEENPRINDLLEFYAGLIRDMSLLYKQQDPDTALLIAISEHDGINLRHMLNQIRLVLENNEYHEDRLNENLKNIQKLKEYTKNVESERLPSLIQNLEQALNYIKPQLSEDEIKQIKKIILRDLKEFVVTAKIEGVWYELRGLNHLVDSIREILKKEYITSEEKCTLIKLVESLQKHDDWEMYKSFLPLRLGRLLNTIGKINVCDRLDIGKEQALGELKEFERAAKKVWIF